MIEIIEEEEQNQIKFIETDDIDAANKVNLDNWVFIGLRYNQFCFKKRVRKR